MLRRPPVERHDNRDRWLVSYADFITLMFALFVVLFASAQAGKSNAREVSDAVKRALGEAPPPPAPIAAKPPAVEAPPDPLAELLPTQQQLSRELLQEIDEGKLEVNLQPRGLVISLRQAAFFSSGADTLDRSSLPTLAKVADVLRTLPNQVRLEGHTDSVPIRTARFGSNWELSSARAIALLAVLTGPLGLSEARFAVAGHADTAPLASNEDAEGRARNRRVDIVILNQMGMHPESPIQKSTSDHSLSRNRSEMHDK